MSIDTDDIKKMIKDHMDQQPYYCKCVECGGNLENSAEVDSDFDLTVHVHPCQNCTTIEGDG